MRNLPRTALVIASMCVAVLASNACATLKNIARTVDDVADIACELFGTENPEEFEAHVRSVLPPGAADQAEADGFDPRILCNIREVVQPFIDDQLRLQQTTKASMRASMSGLEE